MRSIDNYTNPVQRSINVLSEKSNNTISSVPTKLYEVSDATARNWNRLNTSSIGRLTSRANKRESKKRIIPLEYICNHGNISLIQDILYYIDENSLDIRSAILSLGISLLKEKGILAKPHVASVLSEYEDIEVDGELAKAKLPHDESDILGLIYQCYLHEGEKNIKGSYYTPESMVKHITASFDFSNNQTFFDPCCGSGAFFLNIPAKNPTQIFGVDKDEIAVLVSKINLLLKFSDIEFIPQVYCLDYLMGNSLFARHAIYEREFDYIATNPPWGAMNCAHNNASAISSGESFSLFFVQAFNQLKENGTIRFLFPESILNVKAHKDIRKFILEQAGLVSISTYDDMFSGVTTKYIDIECGAGANKDSFSLFKGQEHSVIAIKPIYETENLIFNLLSNEDISIVQTIKKRGRYSLKNSIWALGIVTGDNRRKLFPSCLSGMEKIFTGKEIQPYYLRPAKNYILYDRANLQQVAKDEIYRAPEKLVYKFISKKLVFAYDDSASLFLNSANILIPKIKSMSVKTVLAFLNSTLFQFMYIKLFGEVKVLKGNLIELPFPDISEEDNKLLTSLVDDILSGRDDTKAAIDSYIFSYYGLNEKQINYIRRTVNGNFD